MLIPFLGLTQTEIAERVGVTRSYVGQYLKFTGQLGTLSEARKRKLNEQQQHKTSRILEEEQTKSPYQFLVNVLYAVLNQDWPAQKALEYQSSVQSQPSNISFENLLTIFGMYQEAVESGRKISLEEMANAVDASPGSIGRMLKTVGLKPLYGTRNRKIIPAQKKEEMLRVYDTDLTYTDAAYFLGVKHSIVNQNKPENYGFREERGLLLGQRRLTYRLASQIYEAYDMGFTPDEIPQCIVSACDKKKMVDFALRNRDTFEPQIIAQFQMIWPDKTFDRPYLENPKSSTLSSEAGQEYR